MLYKQSKNFTLYHGLMQDVLPTLPENSVDSVVTDPPYELNFMGKAWDNSGVAFQKDTWERCLRVLKPGGYLLAFGGSRTFHRIACAIEDAGFEIRDTIMWLYGSGFPKSLNISKTIEKREMLIKPTTETLFNNPNEKRDLSKRSDYGYVYKPQLQEAIRWQGWGTSLKPSYEPIIVARKPCEGTWVDNVLKWGVGGLNIDECRIGSEILKGGTMAKMGGGSEGICNYNLIGAERLPREDTYGRYPANTIFTYDDTDFNEVCGGLPVDKNGSAARYFYCAKANIRDRDEGLEYLPVQSLGFSNQAQAAIKHKQNTNDSKLNINKILHRKNIHPTVKPVSLMQYLVRLVVPKGATILDPFMGSGSTGKAVMYENHDRNAEYKFIGIEAYEDYMPIATARIEFVEHNNAKLNSPVKEQSTDDQLRFN